MRKVRLIAGVFGMVAAAIIFYFLVPEFDDIPDLIGFIANLGIISNLPLLYYLFVPLIGVVLTFLGGIAALRGKNWTLAMVGSFSIILVSLKYLGGGIYSVYFRLSFVLLPIGIIAFILTIVSRKGFATPGQAKARPSSQVET